MTERRHGTLGFWGIVGLAFVLRVAMVLSLGWVLKSDGFLFGDSQSYWVLAARLADGESYQYGWEHARCFRMPGYPLALAGLFRLWGDEPPIWAARLLSAVAGSISVALTMVLAKRIVGRRVALWAGIGAAVFPELLLSSSFVLTEAIFAPLMLGQLIALLAALRAPGRGRLLIAASGAGVLGSIAVLVRPSWALAIPILMVALAAHRSPNSNRITSDVHGRPLPRRLYVVAAFVLLLGFIAPLAPWWIRNLQVTGRFVPTTLQTGASLYDGLNPKADGGSNMDEIDDLRVAYLRDQARQHLSPDRALWWQERLPRHRNEPGYWERLRANVTPLWDEVQQAEPSLPVFEYAFDKYLSGLAVRWATEHPGASVQLGFEKVLRVWSPFPSDQWRRYRLFYWGLAIAFILLAFMTAGGGWLGRKSWRDAWLLVFPALYFTAIHAVFVGSIRYREPALYGMIVLAGVAAASVANRLSLGKLE